LRAPARTPFEVAVVGALFAIVATEILVTYWRLPASELYHVSGTGLEGGAGRVLVFLNFPTALVAVAVLMLALERARAVAVVGIALCAVVVAPGVVSEADLDAKWINAVPAVGVALAVALSAGMPERPAPPTRADRVRAAIALGVLALAGPWLAADLGLSFNGVPVLGTLWQSGEPRTQPGLPGLHPAVHHGHHHGMDGALLVWSALVLSRVAGRRRLLGAYLALMLAYGLGEVANDFWLEQVVKRGWTTWSIPDVTRPSLSVAWAVILAGAAVVYAVSRRLAFGLELGRDDLRDLDRPRTAADRHRQHTEHRRDQ
jgi:hypothetical protein